MKGSSVQRWVGPPAWNHTGSGCPERPPRPEDRPPLFLPLFSSQAQGHPQATCVCGGWGRSHSLRRATTLGLPGQGRSAMTWLRVCVCVCVCVHAWVCTGLWTMGCGCVCVWCCVCVCVVWCVCVCVWCGVCVCVFVVWCVCMCTHGCAQDPGARRPALSGTEE